MLDASDEPLRPLSDARELAVSRIQESFAQGEISQQEMNERLDTALTARDAGEALAAVESLPVPPADREISIVATGGRIRRVGAWNVPRIIRIESEYGQVYLDFTRAVFETPVVDIELRLPYGSAKIDVPMDAVVDIDGLHAEWKQPRYTVPYHRRVAVGPTIRVTGSMEYGRLTVRHRS